VRSEKLLSYCVAKNSIADILLPMAAAQQLEPLLEFIARIVARELTAEVDPVDEASAQTRILIAS